MVTDLGLARVTAFPALEIVTGEPESPLAGASAGTAGGAGTAGAFDFAQRTVGGFFADGGS